MNKIKNMIDIKVSNEELRMIEKYRKEKHPYNVVIKMLEEVSEPLEHANIVLYDLHKMLMNKKDKAIAKSICNKINAAQGQVCQFYNKYQEYIQ